MSDGTSKFRFTDEVEETDAKILSQSFNKVYFERPNEATDSLNLARVLFDLREYRKCVNLLKTYANPKYQSAMFLHNYALYMVSEQQKEEEIL